MDKMEISFQACVKNVKSKATLSVLEKKKNFAEYLAHTLSIWKVPGFKLSGSKEVDNETQGEHKETEYTRKSNSNA